MKFKLTILLLILAIGITSAQQKKWTLEQCVEYAVENNLSIEQFELDLQNNQIDESDALGNYLPNLNAAVTASGNRGLSSDPITGQNFTAGIFTLSGGFSSNVTLFNGMRNKNQMNRAKLNAIAGQYRLDDLKDDIRLQVALNYLDVLSNKESLKVFQAQFAATDQDLKRTKELVDSGVLPKGDLLEIEATAANQEQQIVNAQNQVLIARITLAQLLQITDYENFDIADEAFEVPPSDILSNSARSIFAKAVDFRNDIKLSESNVDLAEKDLDISKGARYPTLTAFFNYNTAYSSRKQFNPATQMFSRVDLIDQFWLFDGIVYGGQLNIPIFNRFGTRNAIRRAEISVKKAKVQLEQEKLALETTVNQAYVAVNNSFKSYEAAQKSLEAGQLAYQYSKERYDVGLMNAFEFSQAQARVDNAEATVIQTKYDYIFRLKVLEFYFGIPINLN
jgi:outer membrane protein